MDNPNYTTEQKMAIVAFHLTEALKLARKNAVQECRDQMDNAFNIISPLSTGSTNLDRD